MDPVGGAREHEKDADEDLDGFSAGVECRVHDAARLRELLQLVLETDEDVVFDPGRVARGLLQMLSRLRHVADRVLHLAEQVRDDLPEQKADQHRQHGVVQKDTRSTRDAIERQPLDARPHRRGEHEAKEEQRDEHLQLPDRDEADDGQHRHRGDDERPTRGACPRCHGALRSRARSPFPANSTSIV